MQHLWRLGSDAVGVAVVQRSGSAVPGKKVLFLVRKCCELAGSFL